MYHYIISKNDHNRHDKRETGSAKKVTGVILDLMVNAQDNPIFDGIL
jgi:hypothetical protein